jgi:hypothetical protein
LTSLTRWVALKFLIFVLFTAFAFATEAEYENIQEIGKKIHVKMNNADCEYLADIETLNITEEERVYLESILEVKLASLQRESALEKSIVTTAVSSAVALSSLFIGIPLSYLLMDCDDSDSECWEKLLRYEGAAIMIGLCSLGLNACYVATNYKKINFSMKKMLGNHNKMLANLNLKNQPPWFQEVIKSLTISADK